MKTLITVYLTLTIAVCNGQKTTLEYKDLNLQTEWRKAIIDNADYAFQLYRNYNEVARLKSNSDTLEITSPKVKFIKIDGKVFEIKRDIILEEVKPYSAIPFGTNFTWGIDSVIIKSATSIKK